MTNQTAFLDMISHSEGTSTIGHKDGYDVIVGSTKSKIIRIDSFDDHPRVTVQLSAALWSSAAGRYQIIFSTWARLKATLNLKDFSPAAQDAAAIQLLRECGALPLIDAGKITDAIDSCSKIWASLPGAGYSQHENTFSDLLYAYKQAGGVIS